MISNLQPEVAVALPIDVDSNRLLELTVARALTAVADALGAMAGVDIVVDGSSVTRVPLSEIPSSCGNEEDVAVGVYVGISCEGAGYLALLIDETMARELAAVLLWEDPASVSIYDDLAASALAEAGNVACSAFLNVLGDACGLRLESTPPVVALDMRGALLQAIVAEVAQNGDEALVVGTQLRATDPAANIDTRLMVIPSPDTLARILANLTEAAG